MSVKERTYKIERDSDGTLRVTVELPFTSHELPVRLDLMRHSPDGFEVGYGGSGPAQLALAILADAFDDKTALRMHQGFKHDVVSAIRLADGEAHGIRWSQIKRWETAGRFR